jgi:prepilin-type N-terminal cleavage/methylation domain-containing protein
MKVSRRAFTLIELLIVVAIIAILAAIAIPNLLAAQTRAKVSRVLADHTTIATALESYMVDFGRLPPWDAVSPSLRVFPRGYSVLTTPIAYMGSEYTQFIDPFGRFLQGSNSRVDLYYEGAYGDRNGRTSMNGAVDSYLLESNGPDQRDTFSTRNWGSDTQAIGSFIPYDPTNGMLSSGDIYRVGGRVPQWFRARGWPLVGGAGTR